jgi:hypothetical protein
MDEARLISYPVQTWSNPSPLIEGEEDGVMAL